MKREFLEGLGLEKDAVEQVMAEHKKALQAEQAKTAAAQADRDKHKEQLDTATTELEKFKDAKPDELQATIEKLQADIKAKDEEYAAKEEERAFMESVKEAIKAAGGRNEKAILALLDPAALKGSKNQKEDIAAAIEEVKKDNDYMFGSKEPIQNPTGPTGGGGEDSQESALRAAMGLPAASGK